MRTAINASLTGALKSIFSDLLDAVDSPLISLSNVQRAQVGQGDGLSCLQGGAHSRPAHQVMVNTWNLAVDGTSCYNPHLQTF